MNSSSLTILLFATGLPGHGYEFGIHTPQERASMVADILARPGVAVSERPAVTMVEDEQAQTIWLITQPGHFAHPSLLQRSLVTGEGGRSVQVTGFTAGDAETMARWMGQFRTQDDLSRGQALA